MTKADQKPIAAIEILLLLLLGLLWGIPYALNKIALLSIPPITMTAARVTLAAAALWLILLMTGGTKCFELKTLARLCLQGLIGCVIPYTFIAFGQKSVDSALASILNSTGPLFVCMIGILSRNQETPTALRILGIATGLGGVVIITGVGATAGLGQSTFGELSILLATLSSAFAAIHGRRFVSLAPEFAAAGTLTWGAFFLVPLAFIVEDPLGSGPSAPASLALITNAVFGTALGFVVYFRLIGTLGSSGTVSVGYLRPAVGVLVGSLLLGEHLSPRTAFGLAAILAGVTAINSKITLDRVRPKLAVNLTHDRASDNRSANAAM